MSDMTSYGGNRPSRGSGSLTVHLADELEVYFIEVAHGRPVGFVASPKWKPPTDVYETADEACGNYRRRVTRHRVGRTAHARQ